MSSEAFLSPLWYRVAALRPRLKTQARIRRHRFRGQVWYVVQDPASGRFNRFPPAIYQLLGMMDGRRSMDEIWTSALDQLGEDTPTQEELIRLLSQLHAADLLHCAASPDLTELFDRFEHQSRARRKSNWRNPFSIRFLLWNPDRFLARTLPLFEPLLGWKGAFVYAGVLCLALIQAGMHWPELTENIADRVLVAENVVLLAVCFAMVKVLHELGHGYVTKAGGGEVHEMGILLLVFMPIPYVDASAAHGFPSKWRRVLVGAAGMLTELFIASVCLLVWVTAEAGFLRAVAYNIVLIAGVSTLVFNANPLLRFDGYFILSDLIEIPNLANRSNRYWRYLLERYLFRMPGADAPAATAGERRWFLFYAPAAFSYRIFVLVAIALFIASQWFFIGLVLALWGVFTMLVLPIGKFVGYLLSLPRTARVRNRALWSVALAVAAVAGLFTLVPMPFRIQTEGVLWLPEEAHVRTEADGFVDAVLVRPGTVVQTGTGLVQSADPVLAMQVRVSEGRIAELQARLDQQLFADRVGAELTRQELARELAQLQHLLERTEHLVAKSHASGRLVFDRPEDLPGRYFRKGDTLGYVVHEGSSIVRIVVTQDDVDLVRNSLQRIDVRLAEREDEVYRASLLREVPAAKETLPSSALSSGGGGRIMADPRDPNGATALTSTFQFDLAISEDVQTGNYGGRAYVRLVLRPEPLAHQVYRRIRQLFLAQFHV